jgi:hypothetical protein
MHPLHTMDAAGQDRRGVLFVCPEEGCGRRLRISRTGVLTVLEQGDFYALHAGGTGSLVVDSQLSQDL